MAGKKTTGNANTECERGIRRGADIAHRLLELCAAVIDLVRLLPKDFLGRHVAGQIIRSSTSAGANYEEARSAESRGDFIHKIGLAAKEVRETTFWLKLIRRSSLIATPTLDDALLETNEITAILIASGRTARANAAP